MGFWSLLFAPAQREGLWLKPQTGLLHHRDLELKMRMKQRKWLQREKPEHLAAPEAPNEVWSMNFMADQSPDGRSFRTLNALNHFARDWLTIEVDFSLPPERVVRALN